MFYREAQFKKHPVTVNNAIVGQQVVLSSEVVMRGSPNSSPVGLTLQWQVSVAGGAWQNTGSGSATLTIPSVTAAHNGNKYRVIAYLNGMSETSQVATLTVVNSTVPGAPAAPTNLVAVTASSSRINLTWQDSSSNESGFKVKRRVSGTDSWTEIATLDAGSQTYSSTGLAASSTYEYQVFAFNSVGPAGSNIANARTLAPASTGIPLTVNAVDLSTSQTLALSM